MTGEVQGRPESERTLRDRLTEWSVRTGVSVEVWTLPEPPLGGRLAEIVYGTIRDVLDDLERGPRARTVSIALTVSERGLRLTVSDDGPMAPGPEFIARLRARETSFVRLGGGLTVNHVPRAGTTVSASVPRSGVDSAGGAPDS